MRPEILYPMFKTIDTLPGIGPRNTKLMERVTDGPHVVDLIWHLPTGLIDRSFQPLIKDAPAGRIATLSVTVDNERAHRLYDVLGFDVLREFGAHAWLRPPGQIELP